MMLVDRIAVEQDHLTCVNGSLVRGGGTCRYLLHHGPHSSVMSGSGGGYPCVR